MAALGRLRVKLKSYDHRVIDEAVLKILDTAMATGAKIKGPIPLPTKRSLIPVMK
ncbi:30S ribosomal protein S10, partial [Patescibacteria group bacterium]|nr:30S ribosomal protein S10 [Patescibacteria group bacterium]